MAIALLLSPIGSGRGRADVTPLAFPNLCVDDASGVGSGTIAWTNPTQAQTDTGNNADHAQTLSMGQTQSSHYLKCTDFRFSVPTKSVIDGVTMQFSRRRSANTTHVSGDSHVYAVAPSQFVGSIGTDRSIVPCTDWTTTFNTATYTHPHWGITWAACAPSMPQCGTAFNVNHPGFGAALAARDCNTGTASTSAWVDYVNMQVTYTVTACSNLDWAQPTVSVANSAPGALTTRGTLHPFPGRAATARRRRRRKAAPRRDVDGSVRAARRGSPRASTPATCHRRRRRTSRSSRRSTPS